MEAVESTNVTCGDGIKIPVSHAGETSPSINSEEEKLIEKNRKNMVSMPASVLKDVSDVLVYEKGKRCVSEFPQSADLKGQKMTENSVTEISENGEESGIANCSVDESEVVGNVSEIKENLKVEGKGVEPESISTSHKTENATTVLVEDQNHDAAVKKNDDILTASDDTKPTEEETAIVDTKEVPEAKKSVNTDSNLSQIKSQNLTSSTEEMMPTKKSSLDPKQNQENGGTADEHHHSKKNLSFKDNQDVDPEILRKKDPTKENATKVFRESYFMKTKGKIYFKKKGPFSKWRSQFVILDDNKQQMCFFKSQEEYEKLARCKNTVDLRFITEIKHQRQKIFQSNFPFKVYRRAGLSTVKLAADSEEERARWITTIEEITERIKATPERDLEASQRSSTLPNIKKKKSVDDVSTDSETCTTSSAPEQDDLIRPKKVSKTGFKIDSNQISSIKLKRTSSQMKESRDSKQPEAGDDEEKGKVEASPQEKFGVSLRRVNTEKPKSSRDDREKSPDYVEFKQKYNSLNTARRNKSPNIPLNANSLAKTAIIDSEEQEDRGMISPSQILKDNKDLCRKRSPSPNIPISKGVEAVMKNAEEESVRETTSAQNSLNVSQIRHATLAEVPQHESVIEDLKISDQLTDIQNEKQTSKGELGKSCTVEELPVMSVPTIQLSQLDSYESETAREDPNNRVAATVSESKSENRDKTETISNNTAVVIDVNEPSNTSSDPVHESTTVTNVHPPEESSDHSTDPLKLNAIKKFIQEMKSDESDTESSNNLNVTVVDSSVENSPAIYPRKLSREQKSEESSTNIRLSAFSYGSQLSTESEEPLPRLNFLGKTDRSSTGSGVLKGASSSDEHKSEKTSDSEEMSDFSEIVREKSAESKARPDSFNSLLGGRSSLIAPEFTVVEENSEEIMSATIANASLKVNSEQLVENQLPSQVIKDEKVDSPELLNFEIAVENLAEIKELDHTKSEVTTEIIHDFQKELLDNNALLDAIHMEQAVELSMSPQEELEIMELKPEDNVDRDVKDTKEDEKKYCNKMEMTLLTKTTDNVKVKTTFCKQISASSLHADDTVNINKTTEINSVPGIENIPQIVTESEASGSTNETDDSDGGIEILETQETSDYFPSYGGNDVEYRIKEDHLNIEQTDSIRTSGIVGLKEFLKDNEDSSTSSTEVKSAISRLGHSPAIEKLKDELPKQQL